MDYHWPGNVRELENMVKRMVVLGNEQTVLQEIAGREPGPNNWQRFGRAGGVGWIRKLMAGHSGNFVA